MAGPVRYFGSSSADPVEDGFISFGVHVITDLQFVYSVVRDLFSDAH